MSMDQSVAELLTVDMFTGSRASGDLTRMADRNLTQGLGIIHDIVIQSSGLTTDDPQLMAALSTASRVPLSGSIPTGGSA